MILLLFLSFFKTDIKKIENTADIEIEVKEIRFDKGGAMFLEIVNSENKTVQKKKFALNSKQTTFTFTDLPFGKYAVWAFQDENNNGKLDKNFFGKPIEGWGASNDARGFMSAPAVSKMLFEHKATTKISLKLTR